MDLEQSQHQHPPQLRAKGPETYQPRATPWVANRNESSPEGARHVVPPFQGWFVANANPGRCLGLSCFRTFGAHGNLQDYAFPFAGGVMGLIFYMLAK